MPAPSRRTVLKSIGLLGLSSVAAAGPLERALLGERHSLPALPLRWRGQPYGRIAGPTQPARAAPTTEAEELRQMRLDDVVPVWRVVRGERVFPNNDLWLETKHGYLYASLVQPMWNHGPNAPVGDLGEGRWAWLTVPYSDGYRHPDPDEEDGFVSRLRYGGVMRVAALEAGEDGRAWYRVQELYQSFYVRAAHVRLIPDEALSPLSPEVDPRDKRIEVNLSEQMLVAYEGETAVFAHQVSSGVAEYPTPDGVHYVVDKRISERMVGGIDQYKYNLPAVPFVCYFTWDWAGTHGCYWHNDWGRQRSHGCLNLPPDAARWLWRWTTPHADLDQMVVRPRHKLDGTKIVVRY